jgi:hypothetical protein
MPFQAPAPQSQPLPGHKTYSKTAFYIPAHNSIHLQPDLSPMTPKKITFRFLPIMLIIHQKIPKDSTVHMIHEFPLQIHIEFKFCHMLMPDLLHTIHKKDKNRGHLTLIGFVGIFVIGNLIGPLCDLEPSHYEIFFYQLAKSFDGSVLWFAY